jgi:hypothetical protein
VRSHPYVTSLVLSGDPQTGSSSAIKYSGNKLLCVPANHSLFLAACQLVRDLYYSSDEEERS